jgi:hypothetical protein
MPAFRIFLAALLLAVVGYTIPVVANHGLGLFGVFFGDIAKGAWPGQFNVDFLGFLCLSGFWLAWRHQFSPVGVVLGVLGFFGGIPMLTSYLLIISFTTKGDAAKMLLGRARAAA